MKRTQTARRTLLCLGFLCTPYLALAQDEPIEEIVVTGSYIRGTPENAELPVDVMTAEDLENEGSPSLAEMVRNLSYASGNLAETNQFQPGGQANEGVATINLRGLGSARTLVLINGHRQVATEAVGVDLSGLPMTAVGRFETLKDGAAALYGSDAIGGVVNIITRKGFEGLEIRGSQQWIDKSDGDQQVGGTFGWANESVNFLFAGEYDHRGELRFRDRNWGLIPYDENPEGGWSSIGNPATLFRAAGPGGAFPEGTVIAGGQPSPECDSLGGADKAGFCRFQYTYFDNLIEETDIYKLWTEANVTFGAGHEWHTEVMYSDLKMPDWNTSPSYPPQSLFGPDRYIAPSHPGLAAYKTLHPELFPDTLGYTAADQGAYAWGRYLGVNGLFGEPQTAIRRTKTTRVATSLSGELFDEQLSYDIAVSYSKRKRAIEFTDMAVERMAFALDGLGGSGCTPSTGVPGVGPCEYYNPFANAVESSAVTGQANPDFDPSVANSEDMINWLYDVGRSETDNELIVVDAVFSGETALQLGGGAMGWAAGIQARREKFDFRISDNYNLGLNPCPFADPFSIVLGNTSTLDCAAPTGPYAFLSGSNPERTKRTIYGVFTELALPLTDTLDMQLAVRYEDYGGNVGSTVDPKIAVRWQATDWLAFRGSASTTFRGPQQSYLSGRGTALQFIIPALAFKAVDTLGNPDLQPESAVATNLGVLFETERFYASLDWWRFDFSDPFQTESANQIIGAYETQGCEDGGDGVGSADCAVLRSHVFPTGVSAAGVERIEVNIINGADQKTSGLDLYAEYNFDVGNGTLAVGAEGTYVFEFKSDDFVDINGLKLADGGEFVGLLNDGDPFTPKPELRGDLFAVYNIGAHNFMGVLRYVDSYKDARPPASGPESLSSIDSQVTLDLHYTLQLFEGSTVVSLSAINVTDEDPPLAATDLNYDPFTHNAFGRMIKLGVKFNFGG
jgi:iron complex outermembrane receptor protein